MDKSTGKPPSLEEKKALASCANKDIHHVPHCCSQTESDHGWERDIEAVLDGANREDEEDHDVERSQWVLVRHLNDVFRKLKD